MQSFSVTCLIVCRIRDSLILQRLAHTQEVCGLKWSEDFTCLASGGNDNVVHLWDVNGATPRLSLAQHTSAVKALAWCPWQKDLLATGGGTADRTIKFWNTQTGACINSITTESQVSQLCWSRHSSCRELVSAHGFAQNQIIVWKYPSLKKLTELCAHEQR